MNLKFKIRHIMILVVVVALGVQSALMWRKTSKLLTNYITACDFLCGLYELRLQIEYAVRNRNKQAHTLEQYNKALSAIAKLKEKCERMKYFAWWPFGVIDPADPSEGGMIRELRKIDPDLDFAPNSLYGSPAELLKP